MKGSVKWWMVVILMTAGIVSSPPTNYIFFALAAEPQFIPPEELKKLMEGQADLLVVDVQPKIAYDVGHIRGAVNFPWDSEIIGPVNLPKDKLLILYCDCEHEEDSINIAKQLTQDWGYSSGNIKLLKGGWSGWLKLGYPTEKDKGK